MTISLIRNVMPAFSDGRIVKEESLRNNRQENGSTFSPLIRTSLVSIFGLGFNQISYHASIMKTDYAEYL